jgi:hypothetical protein
LTLLGLGLVPDTPSLCPNGGQLSTSESRLFSQIRKNFRKFVHFSDSRGRKKAPGEGSQFPSFNPEEKFK